MEVVQNKKKNVPLHRLLVGCRYFFTRNFKSLFMNSKVSLFVVVFSLFSTLSFAQLRTPAASPAAKLTQTVGLTEVTLEYSRPSMRGRAIFGGQDALEQYGDIWRTGANAATKVSFSKDVTIGGTTLKSGAYSVLSVPGATEWELMFYTYSTSDFNAYVKATPAATVKVPAQTLSHTVETFTMDVNNIGNDGATLDIMWENTLVSVPFGVSTDAEVMAAFQRMMDGPSVNEYYAMGNYLFETGKDLETALMYVRKGTQGDNARYWNVHREALILGALGKYDEAIATAKKSMEMAKAANSADYMLLNEKAIAQWMKQ